MNILLTGSHGFVGSRIKSQLEHNGHKVFCLERDKVNIYNYKDIGNLVLDNLSTRFVCIHTAAMSDTKSCEENKEEAYKANVLFTQELAHFCADFIAPFIFLSSDQIYDYINEKNHYEYSIPKPGNYYGLTKLWAENVLKEICPRHYIFRLTWQYDLIRPDMPNKGIIYNIVNAVKNNKPIIQSQKSFRYITWVNLTIFYIMQAIMMDIPFGTYNIASVTDKSCYDLFKFTMEKINIDYTKYLIADNTLTPINLTPYPYTLKALGSEITNYEETLINLIKKEGKI